MSSKYYRFIIIFILLILFFHTKSIFSKEISLIAKNPIKDSLFNTHLNYSLVNLFVLGSEPLFEALGSKKYSLVRLSEFLIFSYFTAFNSSMSHEFSHFRISKFYNLDPSIKINVFGGLVRHNRTFNIDINIHTVTAGLNQQEFNSQFIYEKIVLSSRLTYYNGINFMMNHFGTFAYTLITMGGYNSNGNDIMNYEKLTQIKGYKITRQRMFALSSLSIFTNLIIWQNFILSYDFIANNKRETKLLIFAKTLAPPLINYFLTDRGDFLSITLPFVKPTPIFFSVGIGLTNTLFRIGKRIYIVDSQYVKIIPFFYYNKLENNLHGHQLGLEIQLQPIPKKLNLFVIGKHSKHDIMDGLKIESGFNIFFGTAFMF